MTTNTEDCADTVRAPASPSPSPSSSSSLRPDAALSLQATPTVLESFSDDVGSLWCPSSPTASPRIDVLDELPDPDEFHRRYVAKSIPCLIRCPLPLHLAVDDVVGLAAARCSVNGQDDDSDDDGDNDDADAADDDDVLVTVDVTPDGHGDCIRTVVVHGEKEGQSGSTIKRMFVKPQEERMTLQEFRQRLRSQPRPSEATCADSEAGQEAVSPPTTRVRSPQPTQADSDGLTVYPVCQHQQADEDENDRQDPDESVGVVYYSHQNDCLRQELPCLWNDRHQQLFPTTWAFAEEGFGTGPPEAINLWMGNERSVSSMHKDHYENIFWVLSGEKVFHLCPPADAPFLYLEEVETGSFQQQSRLRAQEQEEEQSTKERQSTTNTSDSQWTVVPDVDDTASTNSPTVQWIAADVTKKDDPNYLRRFPLLRHTHPIEVRVPAGFMLYLPSLWFHRVTQSCETVGVNYWYPMAFDSPLWCYFNLLQQLKVIPTRTN